MKLWICKCNLLQIYNIILFEIYFMNGTSLGECLKKQTDL